MHLLRNCAYRRRFAPEKLRAFAAPSQPGRTKCQRLKLHSWEGGHAEVLETCLAHWPQLLEVSSLSWDSKGFFGSIPSRAARRGGASVFPLRRGIVPGLTGPICLAQAKKKQGKFGPDEVPFRRNPEQQNFTEAGGNSQGIF